MISDSLELKRKGLHKIYGHLNENQREAVFQIKGPLLILAGAGSGKTTVLINRIQYMVKYGDAYTADTNPLTPEGQKAVEDFLEGNRSQADTEEYLSAYPIKPWTILAITFTNKAAGELRERLSVSLGEETARELLAATFHSLCMRILRRYVDRLGYDTNFTVYDTDDSLRVIKDGIKINNLDEKILRPRAILSAISRAKDRMETPEDTRHRAGEDYREQLVAKVYAYYQTTLKNANAVDFDDIIGLTVRLFQEQPDVLEYYQNRYRYIMVDEYQDTNQTQYLLVSLLAEKYKNLCVVGDDDQSIYKFRGATIENILSFENQFEDTMVIRLEQNYRSSQNILTAANRLIENNTARKGKNLWTDAGEGEKLTLKTLANETEEARFISDTIMNHVEEGGKWGDNAVLYRMNAQSGAIERALAQRAIPYRIVGGLRFYERKEIKDVVAYLSVLNNPTDDLRLARIVNEPKRGIGATTIGTALEIGSMVNESLFTVLAKSDQYVKLSRRSGALAEFAAMMEELMGLVDTVSLEELFDILMDKTGYMRYLESEGNEGIPRIENVLELKSNMMQYSEATEEPTLFGFLDEISLYTDLDNYDIGADAVTLMTVHSAKGLEFPVVYIAGMEEGIFPGYNSFNFPEEIEEERRLAYVAITRAKQELFIVGATSRMLFGKTNYSKPSRFISELPPVVIENKTTLKVSTQIVSEAVQAEQSKLHSAAGAQPKTYRPAAQTDFEDGARVFHKVFGEGTVLSSKPMGGDVLLEIDFDTKGVKKVMATFARLERR